MVFDFNKFIAFVMVLIAWILLTFFFVGCANVDKVQEDEGWFPIGMREDAQDFYNSKYNMIDNGYSDPNANVRVFSTKY